MRQILWKDIKIGDEFIDGSKVVSIHQSYIDDCYCIYYKNKSKKDAEIKSIILSQDHLLLCDISKLSRKYKTFILKNFTDYGIPTVVDKHVYFDKEKDQILSEKYIVVEYDKSNVDKYLYWLPINLIFLLVNKFKQKIYCNNNIIINCTFEGKKEVFCVQTDTHKFEVNGLIHHNSVTLRNIIFHCLTHGEQIALALVDIKYTEFTYFKGMKNVIAVANTVKETVELLRIAKEVMYKRNQEMAKLGITDIKDFKPQKPTDEVIVAGRKLKDTDKVEIKVNGEIKTVTVKELENYLQ